MNLDFEFDDQGLDTLVDIGEKYRCIWRYSGHSQGIRDVGFSPDDGRTFLTASYNRSILWYTETGLVVSSFDAQTIPYCVRFSPSKPNEFLAGCSSKVVLQYDVHDANNTVQRHDAVYFKCTSRTDI